MLEISIWLIYFLIGFVLSRIGIVRKHNLIWNDSGVHTVLLTVFWLPFLFLAIVLYTFKLIGKVIDPIIRKF